MFQSVIKWLLPVLLLILIPVSQAQMVGSPAGNQGAQEWSVSCNGSFMTQEVGLDIAHSQRWLLKNTYGVLPWLDLVGTLGMANLKLDSKESDIQDYEGKNAFAFGLGMTATLKKEAENQPMGIIAGAHLLQFPSKGKSYQIISDLVRRRNQLEFTWREYMFFGGLSYRIGNLRLYGCGIGWGINRTEKWGQYEFNENIEDWDFIKEVKSEYQSELWTGALAGIEVVFPNTRYTIGFEGLFYNANNYVLMVGVGQTGIFEAGW